MSSVKKIDFSSLRLVTNEKYYPLYKNTDRYLVLVGGAGSGKSHFCAQKIVYRLFAEDVGHRFLVLRKYSPNLERSAFALVKDYIAKWGLWEFVSVKTKPMYIRNNINGNEIIFSGLDDVEKIKSIENITSIWYEEATEADERDVIQLDLRLRPKFKNNCKDAKKGCYAQIMFSYNPISKKCWTYSAHHNPKKLSYRKKIKTEIQYLGKTETIESYMTVLHSTYKDNRYLNPEYVATLEDMINRDITYYKIYAKGEYADLKNKIYNNVTLLDEFPEITPDFIGYGLDFGYAHPMALVKNIAKGNKRYVQTIFHESGYDTKQFIEFLDDINFSKSALIYADPAEPDRIHQIYQAGYNIRPAYKAPGSVLAGIDHCKSLDVYVLKSDTKLRNEFFTYKYKEDSSGNIIYDVNGKESPVKYDDDALDAWRYDEYTRFIQGGRTPSCKIITY